MFTERVISGGDPARKDAPTVLQVSGVGAQGTGVAWIQEGQIFGEFTYTNSDLSPQQLAQTSRELLAKVATTLAGRLPSTGKKLAALGTLPVEDQLALGVLYEPKNAFGVPGGGAGAQGFYRQGEKRYRILSIVRDDEDQAKDILGTLLKREGASKVKELGDGAVRLMVGDQPRTEWIVMRKGAQVFGVGDETNVLQVGMSNAQHDAVCLSKEEKVERLKKLQAIGR